MMFEQSKTLGIAAIFVLGSAALHILAPLLGGFASGILYLMPIGLVFAVMGYFLPQNRRWLSWLAFFIMLFSGIFALAGMMNPSLLPVWWYGLIMIANWTAAILLFGHLWHPKTAKAAKT